ncbi:MAG: AAA family ATPase [Carbonactinosporaceae bacterium]
MRKLRRHGEGSESTNRHDGLVGREAILALLKGCYDRPTGRVRPVPIVVLSGAGGSGKTALLTHVKQQCRDLPVAVVDNLAPDVEHQTIAVLGSVSAQLRLYRHPMFGRLRLPRYEFAELVGAVRKSLPEPREAAGRGRLVQQVASHRSQPLLSRLGGSEAVQRSWWLVLLVMLAGIVVRRLLVWRTPLRALLWPRGVAGGLRWYERERVRLGLPEGARIDTVAGKLWQLWAGVDDESPRATQDMENLLIDALLADLRAAYRTRWLRRRDPYRSVNCVLLLDDVDLLPPGKDNVLTQLAARRVRRPDTPLLVIAAQQLGGLARDPAVASQTPEEEAARIYDEWAARLEGTRAADTASPTEAYLHLSLDPLELQETEQLLTALRVAEGVRAPGFALVHWLQHVTRGHPLAVKLLQDARHRTIQRMPFRTPPLRELLDEPVGPDFPEGAGDTLAGFLQMRLLHRLRTEREQALVELAAPRRLDVPVIQKILGIDEPAAEKLLWELSTYSFAEDAADGRTLALHSLLRDLLTKSMKATQYRRVHEKLRDHFHELAGQGVATARGEHAYHALALGHLEPAARHVDELRQYGNPLWVTELRRIAEAPTPWRMRRTVGRIDQINPLAVEAVELSWQLWSVTGTSSVPPGQIAELAEVIDKLSTPDMPEAVEQVAHYRRMARETARRSHGGDLSRLPEYARRGSHHPYPRRRPSRRTRKLIAAILILAAPVGYAGAHATYWATHCNARAPWDAWTDGYWATWSQPMGLEKRPGRECVGVAAGVGPFVQGGQPSSPEDREVNRLASLIQDQNDRVMQKAQGGTEHLTIVVTAILSSANEGPKRDITAGVNELRGAYLAQRNWNAFIGKGLRSEPIHPFLLRVLVANVGGNSAYGREVAEQISGLALEDESFVAVTGMGQTRDATLAAVRLLGRHDIPMVASALSGDRFTGMPYFLRVTPSNARQARVGAAWAADRYRGSRPHLVYDAGDRYSRELKGVFEDQLADYADERALLTPRPPESGDPGQIAREICRGDDGVRELVVYTGRANELVTLLHELDMNGCYDPDDPDADTVVLGADDLSQLETGGLNQLPTFVSGRLCYTTFGADEETWRAGGGDPTGAVSEFFAAHAQARADYGEGKDAAYRSPPNGHVMLAHDSVGLVLHAADSQDPGDITRGSMYQALLRSSFDGATGPIDFPDQQAGDARSGADPLGKRVWMYCLERDPDTRTWQKVYAADSLSGPVGPG